LAGADGAKIQPIVELGQNIFKKKRISMIQKSKIQNHPRPSRDGRTNKTHLKTSFFSR
jgi:hypothetical protein